MELLPRKTFGERPLERFDWRTVYFGKDYVGTAAPGRPRPSAAVRGAQLRRIRPLSPATGNYEIRRVCENLSRLP